MVECMIKLAHKKDKFMDKKKLYLDLVREWSARMNLVAKSTLDDLEHRHWEDSVQVADYLPPTKNGKAVFDFPTRGVGYTVIDLGSGAGFPGIVLAILGFKVMCIESISKKAAFLNEVKTKLSLDNLTVWNSRIEDRIREIKGLQSGSPRPLAKAVLPAGNFSGVVFVARAFANLSKILALTQGVRGVRYVLLKGRSIQDEIDEALKLFKFSYKLTPSKTGDGFVLECSM
jgi:16S rRNA (guanine527-N7)-methyltransferase